MPKLIRVCATCKRLINKVGRGAGADTAPSAANRTHGMCGACFIAGASTDEEYAEALQDCLSDLERGAA